MKTIPFQFECHSNEAAMYCLQIAITNGSVNTILFLVFSVCSQLPLGLDDFCELGNRLRMNHISGRPGGDKWKGLQDSRNLRINGSPLKSFLPIGMEWVLILTFSRLVHTACSYEQYTRKLASHGCHFNVPSLFQDFTMSLKMAKITTRSNALINPIHPNPLQLVKPQPANNKLTTSSLCVCY